MKLGLIGLVGVALALAVAFFPEKPSDTEMSWNASGRVGAVAAGDSRAVAAGIEILSEEATPPMPRSPSSWRSA